LAPIGTRTSSPKCRVATATTPASKARRPGTSAGRTGGERLHDFADRTERLLVMVLLVLFGGALTPCLPRPFATRGKS
jgi:hypothetical protein